VTYPAVMFTTGLNDTRVDSWQPAKAAALPHVVSEMQRLVDLAGGKGAGGVPPASRVSAALAAGARQHELKKLTKGP